MTNDISGVHIDQLEVAAPTAPEPAAILLVTSGLLAIFVTKRLCRYGDAERH